MCADCRVVERELAAEPDSAPGIQIVRVHPETDVARITEITR